MRARRDARAGRAGRCRAAADRRLLGRHAPAARDRPGARRPAAAAASSTSRSARSIRRAGATCWRLIADLRGERDGHLLDPRPGRRRADLRPGRDHGPRPAGDRGAARRRCSAALRPAALPDRAGARAGGGAGRAGRHAAGVAWVDGRHRRDGEAADRVGHATRRPPRPGCCRWSWRPACAWPPSNGSGRRSRTSSCGWSAGDGAERRRRDERRLARPAPQGAARVVADAAPADRRRAVPARRPVLAAARAVPAGDHQGGGRRPAAGHPDPDAGRRPTRRTSSGRTSPSSGRSRRSCWRWAPWPRNGIAARPRSSSSKTVSRGAFIGAKVAATRAGPRRLRRAGRRGRLVLHGGPVRAAARPRLGRPGDPGLAQPRRPGRPSRSSPAR